MLRLLTAAAAAIVLLSSGAVAQTPEWKVRGDTSGGPPGCAASAVAAIDLFFRAMQAADSTRLAKAVAPRFVFSTGRWTASDTFAQIETVAALVRYAKKRARAQERMQIQSVQFNHWRGRELHFGPIYFLRSARDLGPDTRSAAGKGMYACGEGLRVLNLGRPTST